MAMQTLQPKVKQIQERYKGKDQQEMQIQVGQLYKEAGVNPLAGCLPTLATLPVWIGLYRWGNRYSSLEFQHRRNLVSAASP
jgi:YidC/Oxa1 family membrane protein insertase